MIHDGAHERLLERILVGELDEQAPEATRLLASCSKCQDELTRLHRLEQRLADAADRQRADFDWARGSSDANDEQRVRQSLGLALARPRGRRLHFAWIAAAAAILALLGWMAFRPGPAPAGTREIQLGGAIAIHFDSGSGKLVWVGQPRDTFVVEVRAARDGRGGELLLSTSVSEPAWSPSPEQIALFPTEIFVTVMAEDQTSGWLVLSRDSFSGL